jgi:hypothetical protein
MLRKMTFETRVPYFLELSSLTMVPTIVSVSSALGNVRGGVGLIPTETLVRLLLGEDGSHFVTIHNSQDRPVHVSFHPSVATYPQKAIGGALVLDHQRMFTARPGNNRLMVKVNARPNATCGTYIIANGVYF